jgi:hypothetical protein
MHAYCSHVQMIYVRSRKRTVSFNYLFIKYSTEEEHTSVCMVRALSRGGNVVI